MFALASASSHKWDPLMTRCADSTRVYQLPVLTRSLIWFGSFLVNLLCGTLRYKVIDEAGFLDGPFPGPVIILIWHNRILAMPALFRRYYPKRKGLLVLTSASRDGAYLSEFVRCFGMGAVRGSSSRRGAAALLDLVRGIPSDPVPFFCRKDAKCLSCRC